MLCIYPFEDMSDKDGASCCHCIIWLVIIAWFCSAHVAPCSIACLLSSIIAILLIAIALALASVLYACS
jgi:hypothetical protein